MKLYWFLGSQPARAVKCLLDIGKIHCELEERGVANKATRTPEFLRLNPLGQIPFLVDGKFKLGQSNAILAYLCQKHPQLQSWYGTTIEERAKVNQHLSWYQSYFRPALFKIIKLKVYHGIRQELPVYAEDVQQAEQNMYKAMEEFEGLLSKVESDFVCGDQPTIADLQYYFEITNFVVYELSFSHFKAINRWYNRVETIPEVRKITEEWRVVAPETTKRLKSVILRQRSML